VTIHPAPTAGEKQKKLFHQTIFRYIPAANVVRNIATNAVAAMAPYVLNAVQKNTRIMIKYMLNN